MTIIRKELRTACSGRESSRVVLEVNTKTGKSQFMIEKSYREYYPVTDYKKVLKLHDDLNRGGGRRAYLLNDLIN